MEDAFKKLQDDGKNSVNNLIKWMKDCKFAKIIDGAKVTEDNTRKMFSGVKDETNVEMSKFRDVLEKTAASQKRSVNEYIDTLAKEGSKFVSSAAEAIGAAAAAASSAAATAFSNAVKK